MGQGLPPRSRRWRVRGYMGSGGHVVGMLFAIAGILLFNNGLTSGIIGLGLIPVLYATGYFLAERPRPTPLDDRRQVASDSPRIRDGLDDLLAAVKKRVPLDVYYRVESIRDAIVFTVENTGAAAVTDPDVHLVRRTATTYLPDALSTYLSLPRTYAEGQVVQDGRTPHDLLIEQLSLMEAETHRVARTTIRQNSQRLVTHGRFIADRYAASNLELGEGRRL